MNLRLLSGFTVSRRLLLAGFLLCVAGCSQSVGTDYSQLDLVDVSGTVTLDGQPLSGVTVAFESPEGTFSYGVTDEAGKYNLMFNSEKSGCLTGEKTVRIRFVNDSESPDDGGDTEEGAAEVMDTPSQVPEQYNKQSTLKATVDADHTTFDFDLKSGS